MKAFNNRHTSKKPVNEQTHLHSPYQKPVYTEKTFKNKKPKTTKIKKKPLRKHIQLLETNIN